MRRRTLLATLLTVLGAGLPSHAAGPSVVILTDGQVAQYREALAAAREVLKDAPVVDLHDADAASRLVNAPVILAIGQRATQLAQASAPTAAIVACMVLGRTISGSRGLTGLHLEVSLETQLQLLHRVHPTLKRVGVLYQEKVSAEAITQARRISTGLGLSLVTRAVTDAREVRGTLTELAPSIDGLWLLQDSQLISVDMVNFLLVFTLEHKLPLFGFLESFTKVGALAAISPDYKQIGQRAARLAAELLARPLEARFPVPPMSGSPGSLSVNLKTARQLGIDIPADVVATATQVYR